MKRIVFVLLATVISSGVFAQDAKSIITKYYNAIGGKSAETNIKSYVSNSTMSVMGQFMDVKQSVIVGESAKLSMVAEGMEIVQVWNKDKGWMIDPMSGNVVDLTQEQAAPLINLTDLFNKIKPDALDENAEAIGKKEFNGESLDGVSFKRDGQLIKLYFDDKGLLKVTESDTEQGPVTVTYSDYRELEFGYKIPYKIVTSTTMYDLEMVIADFKINEKIDPAIFNKP